MIRNNILILLIDSARADSFSCYGYPRATTPNIDKIASQGVIYTNAITTSSWTLAATASLFTGKLVSEHNTCDHNQYLSANNKTMAEVLDENGYETIAVSDNSYVGSLTGLEKGFMNFNYMKFGELSLTDKLLKLFKVLFELKKRISKEPIKYCNTLIQLREMQHWLNNYHFQKPFFMYAHFNQIHYPYLPNIFFRNRFRRITRSELKNTNQDREYFIAGKKEMNESDFSVLKALYDGELAYLDWCFGRFFKFLEKKNILNNTLVIIVGDHGDNFGEHGLLGHGLCLYDSILKIPMIVRYPNRINPGRVDYQVQITDILPSVIDLFGLKWNERNGIYGQNIFNKEMPNRDFAISEHAFQNMALFKRKVPEVDQSIINAYERSLHSIRTNGYKFIWSSNGKHELYNLKQDPQENQNLYFTRQSIAKKMEDKLFSNTKQFESKDISQEPVEMDSTFEERLKALGYL
jgi:arylsulfatase A-like enzyme